MDKALLEICQLQNVILKFKKLPTSLVFKKAASTKIGPSVQIKSDKVTFLDMDLRIGTVAVSY